MRCVAIAPENGYTGENQNGRYAYAGPVRVRVYSYTDFRYRHVCHHPTGGGDRLHGGGPVCVLVRQQASRLLSAGGGLCRDGAESVSEAAVPHSPPVGAGQQFHHRGECPRPGHRLLFPQRTYPKCRGHLRRYRPVYPPQMGAGDRHCHCCAGALFPHVSGRPHTAGRGGGRRHRRDPAAGALSRHGAQRQPARSDGRGHCGDDRPVRGISAVRVTVPLPGGCRR